MKPSKIVAILLFSLMILGLLSASFLADTRSAGLLLFALFLGLITGKIGQSKGRDFFTWWTYGWCMFLIALIHGLCMQHREAESAVSMLPRPTESWPVPALPAPPAARYYEVVSEEQARHVFLQWRKCAGCAELIRAEAVVCRHCGTK
jgi:hypothetical protein